MSVAAHPLDRGIFLTATAAQDEGQEPLPSPPAGLWHLGECREDGPAERFFTACGWIGGLWFDGVVRGTNAEDIIWRMEYRQVPVDDIPPADLCPVCFPPIPPPDPNRSLFASTEEEEGAVVDGRAAA